MRHAPWSLRPPADEGPPPLGTSQPSVQVGPAWRANQLESGRVVTVAANYATMGSASRHHWTPTINPFPPSSQDPRLPASNNMFPTGAFHLRITTPTELAAFAASHRNVNVGEPVTYTPPGLATLLRTGI